MKYFIVHTPSYIGNHEGKLPVAASTAAKAVEKYYRVIDHGGARPPKRYYAVEITKEEFNAYPENGKIY